MVRSMPLFILSHVYAYSNTQKYVHFYMHCIGYFIYYPADNVLLQLMHLGRTQFIQVFQVPRSIH